MGSKELNKNGTATKKLTKITPITFDEVAAIIQSGDSEKLRESIESGRVSDINMNDISNGHVSLLMVACKSGFIECARVLIDNNADINYLNNDHNISNMGYRVFSDSVLISACLSGNIDVLKLIIACGATIKEHSIMSIQI